MLRVLLHGQGPPEVFVQQIQSLQNPDLRTQATHRLLIRGRKHLRYIPSLQVHRVENEEEYPNIQAEPKCGVIFGRLRLLIRPKIFRKGGAEYPESSYLP